MMKAKRRKGVTQQQHDHRQCQTADGRDLRVDLANPPEKIESLDDPVGEGALVAGQVAQLTQDDQHGHAVEKAGHDCVGDEAGQGAEAEQAHQELDQTDHQHQRGQRLRPLAGRDVGQCGARRNRQGRRGGDIHKSRAGEDCADRGGDHQREDAEHRIDCRQQRVPHRLRHVDDRKRQSGYQIRGKIPTLRYQFLCPGAKLLHACRVGHLSSNASGPVGSPAALKRIAWPHAGHQRPEKAERWRNHWSIGSWKQIAAEGKMLRRHGVVDDDHYVRALTGSRQSSRRRATSRRSARSGRAAAHREQRLAGER